MHNGQQAKRKQQLDKGANMKLSYVSRAPDHNKSDCYRKGRLPESERMGDRDWIFKRLSHSTTTEVTPRSVVRQNLAAQKERVQKMFANMKAVENVPVVSRGRAGADLTQTEEFKALASMPVTHKDDRN